MIEPGDTAWIRVRALNNALEKHPDPAISQEDHVGIFGAKGKDREYLNRFAGIRRVAGNQDYETTVDVLAVGLPYGKRGQRVGVRVHATLSDDTEAVVDVHKRSVESTIEREVNADIWSRERASLLAEIATSADPNCKRCKGTGAVMNSTGPCRECTGVTYSEFRRRLEGGK